MEFPVEIDRLFQIHSYKDVVQWLHSVSLGWQIGFWFCVVGVLAFVIIAIKGMVPKH